MAERKPHPSCAVGDYLEERDGKLFVKTVLALSSEPGTCRALFYPLGLRGMDLRVYENDKRRIGMKLDYKGDGVYEDPYEVRRELPGGRGLTYRLKQGGRTTAEHIESWTIPPPKVKRPEDAQWDDVRGIWKKFLKTKGWVAA